MYVQQENRPYELCTEGLILTFEAWVMENGFDYIYLHKNTIERI
jgi:hypothetical protein